MTGPHQADISEQLSNLSLVPPHKQSNEISPMSSDDASPKRFRPRISDSRSSNFFSAGSSLLDPLLYLRVSQSASTPAVAAVLPEPNVVLTLDEILAADRERTRLLTDFPSVSTKKHDLTKSKQTPVSEGPRLPVSVYKFCKENAIKYTTLALKKSYRSIVFRRENEQRSLDPWASFISDNNLSHYRLCHAVYFGTDVGRLVCLVPHLSGGKVEASFLSSILKISVFKVSLGTIQKDLGLPTFVTPPFALSSVPVLTVIDASLVEPVSTDCVFELGSTGLRIRPTELARLARKLNWTVVPHLNSNSE